MSKVLFLCDNELKNPMRGTPIHVARLLTELRKEHDLVVCAASVPDALTDIFVTYPRGKGFSKLRALLRIVDEHKPDTILTIGLVGLLGPVLIKLLRRVRIVVELQGIEYVEKYAFGHIGLFHYYFWKYKSMLLLPLYDVVIAFTRSSAALYPFLKKVVFIFPGIDIDTLPHATQRAIPPLVVGYTGNTDEYQGLRYAIDAVALLRKEGVDARLHLVLSGSDQKVQATYDHIAHCNLNDTATILRNLPHHQSVQEMLNASVLVIPRTSTLEAVYGFPSKLPESLALGLPVIATNVGAVPELMPEIGEHAFVIPCENITQHIVTALKDIASMDSAERERRGSATRNYAKTFSWERATAIVSQTL